MHTLTLSATQRLLILEMAAWRSGDFFTIDVSRSTDALEEAFKSLPLSLAASFINKTDKVELSKNECICAFILMGYHKRDNNRDSQEAVDRWVLAEYTMNLISEAIGTDFLVDSAAFAQFHTNYMKANSAQRYGQAFLNAFSHNPVVDAFRTGPYLWEECNANVAAYKINNVLYLLT